MSNSTGTLVVPRNLTLRPGRPDPLGATWDGEGVNFAIFSEHAEKVELCLFHHGREEKLPLRECTHNIFHGYLPGAGPGGGAGAPGVPAGPGDRIAPTRGGYWLSQPQDASRAYLRTRVTAGTGRVGFHETTPSTLTKLPTVGKCAELLASSTDSSVDPAIFRPPVGPKEAHK